MIIEEVKIGKYSSYIRKDEKYYLRQFNQHTNAVSLIGPFEWNEEGKAKVSTSSQCYSMVEKEKLDILFVTDGRKYQDTSELADKLANIMNTDSSIPDSAIDEFEKDPVGTIQKYEKKQRNQKRY
jgi:hypothetical protein